MDNFDTGICELNLYVSTYEDSGVWKCFMGQSYPPTLDIIESINVRIGEPIAALYPLVSGDLNKPASLHCITAGEIASLKYCRFEAPDGTRFNIDNSVTPDK